MRRERASMDLAALLEMHSISLLAYEKLQRANPDPDGQFLSRDDWPSWRLNKLLPPFNFDNEKNHFQMII